MTMEANNIEQFIRQSKTEFPLAFTHARYYRGHGKLMLSGEYVSLYGAEVLALPTKLGQAMVVRQRKSNAPSLFWKGIDCNGKEWFSAKFELWHLGIEEWSGQSENNAQYLEKLLKSARKLNPHFLRDEEDVFVETRLEFPLSWGLGSSSTLIYNVAQWAYISPVELFRSFSKGSGYDVACAEAHGPILYKWEQSSAIWQVIPFAPDFRDQLFFIYLGEKMNTDVELTRFLEMNSDVSKLQVIATKISAITRKMVQCKKLQDFELLLVEHEQIISLLIDRPPIKQNQFADYWGEIKSLGAWGGDFILATSDRGEAMTKEYFFKRGYEQCFLYDDLINYRQPATAKSELQSEFNMSVTPRSEPGSESKFEH